MPSKLVPPVVTETAATELRADVRAFLHGQISAGAFVPRVDAWLTGWDPRFTRALAERGWVGMTIPTEYGGRSRTFMERFVVTEELLAVGAPVAAQWITDRQVAPSLLKFGTEAQKRHYLPLIARGECVFAIGMSEPESGSDLASVRTRGERVDGGWLITGSKVWTSGAHVADAFFVLARTAALDPEQRHAGLSQFIVDLGAPGVTIRPITSMSGDHHFNEVFLDEVFVPDDMVLGEIGAGWTQVTSELSYERSGPERFLSTFTLLSEIFNGMGRDEVPRGSEAGRYVARLAGLHQMSLAVSGALERREQVDTAAALVKVLGTTTEGDIVDFADTMAAQPIADDDSRYADLLAEGLLQRPGFTIRGGTNEVLRGVIARGLGMR